jgi:hypothetical protein
MTRSTKKNPVSGHTSASTEKQDKRKNNRKIRKAVRKVLSGDPHAEILPHERELTNPWLMDKDGKGRFDPAQFPRGMRK